MKHSAVLALTVPFLLAVSAPSWAGWVLDNNQSRINFITIKNGSVAEKHSFDSQEGTIDDSGQAHVAIMLDSVNTGIEIRDERMRKMFAEDGGSDLAVVDATLDAASLEALAVGSSEIVPLKATFRIGEADVEVATDVHVLRIDEARIQASSLSPVLLDAAALGLDGGVEKLREIAGLASISLAVPVDFRWVFVRE